MGNQQTGQAGTFDDYVRLPLSTIRNKLVARSRVETRTYMMPARAFDARCRDPAALETVTYMVLQKSAAGRKTPLPPFLLPTILPRFLPFVIDQLHLLMRVSPTWYVVLHDFILRQYSCKFLQDFSRIYHTHLRFQTATISIQRLQTRRAGVRVDVLLYAQVLSPLPSFGPAEIRYIDEYFTGGQMSVHDYRFVARKKGSARRVWVRRDVTSFHGEEVNACSTPTTPEICVGDYVEIPVNLCNGKGAVDPYKIKWRELRKVDRTGITCTLEENRFVWFDKAAFEQRNQTPPPNMDLFPQSMKMKRAQFASCSITIGKAEYEPLRPGPVEAGEAKVLGSRVLVVPRTQPLIVPLQRQGLEHDRLTNHVLRMGDHFAVYLVLGGPKV